MLRKFLIYCVPIVVLAMLAMPAFAAVTVTYPAITHSWPDLTADVRDSSASGSRLWVNTMAGTIFNGDPNDLYSDQSPPYQRVGENFNDRAVQGTFGVRNWPADVEMPYGFTLTHIVITAFGGGNDQNLPCSLHIYDMNTKDPWPYTGTQTGYNLVGGAGGATVANDCMLPPGELLPSSATFIYKRDATANLPDNFVDFNFTGYDSFDLEPNHEYAFEIWPTKGNDPGWFWIRDTSSQNYPHGKCYRVDPPTDYRDLTSQRQAVAAGVRVQVMGVYGIPCDGNAFHPVPRNLEIDVALDSKLNWHPGKWCWGGGPDVNHGLYFSTSESAVRSRGTAARRGFGSPPRLYDANYANPNEPNWAPDGGFAADTTYYWRVDEYNNVTAPGYWGRSNYGYWVFRTSGPQATQPSPSSPSALTEFKPERAWLSWKRGCYIGSGDTNAHKVYFGTNFNDVCDATTAAPIYRGTTTDPCYPLKNLAGDYTLNSGTTYYWRVDEVNATVPRTDKGNVWQFTMPNPAYILLDNFGYPSPADLAVVWKTGYRLPYTPPGGAGNDSDMNDVSGSITVAGSVMSLAYDNTYTINGPWSETALDYNYVSSTGMDWTLGGVFVPKAIGILYDGTVGNTLNSADANNDKMYIGIQDSQGRLGVVYLNSDVYAAQRDITIESGNLGTRELKVSLADLTSPNNVDLTEVNKVFVGIGSPRGAFQNLYSGGTGTLQYASLKVYVQHCNPPPSNVSMVAGDFGGPRVGGQQNRFTKADCIVNYNDIFFFAADWLFNEPNKDFTATYSDPGTTDLTVWYKFDDPENAPTITDSSTNGRNGTLNNSGPFTWWYKGHDGTGKCLNLEHGYKTWVECPNTVVNTVVDGPETATGQTFAFWLWYNENFYPAHVWSSVLVFFAGAPGAGGAQQIETQLPVPFTPGDQSRPWLRFVNVVAARETGRQVVRESLISSRWNHYALVLDSANTVMRMYINGVQDNNAAFDNLTAVFDPNSVRIGTRSNGANPATDAGYSGGGFWHGKIDDMRLYKRALTAAEIQWLATDGTGKLDMQKAFVEPEEVAGSPSVALPTGQTVKIINFNDFAQEAGYWLNQALWP